MRTHTLRLLGALLIATVLVGCDDDADAPKDTDDTEDTVDTVETDDTEEDPDAACWVPSDIGECWDCPPPTEPRKDDLAFLNACDNTSSYVVFDNAKRIPASTWVPGTPLPQL